MLARMPESVLPIVQHVKESQGFTTNKQALQFIIMKFAEHEARRPSPTPTTALQLIATRQLTPSHAVLGQPDHAGNPTEDGPAFVENDLT